MRQFTAWVRVSRIKHIKAAYDFLQIQKELTGFEGNRMQL